MTDLKTISVYNSKSNEYYSLTNANKPSKHLISFMSRIDVGGTVLDLGCCPGNAAAFMAQKGFEVIATDASLEMVKLAKLKNNIDALHQSFDDIQWVDNFDGVWAHFSLLHATKENFPLHLKALYGSLKSKGILTIGMKIGKGEKRDGIGRFYAYYSNSELKKILEDTGFTIQDTSYGEDIGLDGKLAPWIIIRAHA